MSALSSTAWSLRQNSGWALPRTPAEEKAGKLKARHHSDNFLISDSLILHMAPTRLGLYILIRQCAHIINALLDNGFLTRGAINTGPLWVPYGEDRNLIGSGFIDAYLLEKEYARHPRVVLSPNLVKKYLPLRPVKVSKNAQIIDVSMVGPDSLIQDYDGKYYIHSLRREYFGPGSIRASRFSVSDFDEFIVKARACCKQNLRLWPLDSSAHAHWLWAKNYIDRATKS